MSTLQSTLHLKKPECDNVKIIIDHKNIRLELQYEQLIDGLSEGSFFRSHYSEMHTLIENGR